MPTTVCLNMIVKNEAHVIRRCLDSVRPFVDHWMIVDTGSTDGTQDIIRAHFGDIPGELHERPWRNFGHNRSEALDFTRGKADYILIMDADNIFCAPAGWHWPELTAAAYEIMHKSSGTEYAGCVLVSNRLRWRYVGVLHEYIASDEPYRAEVLPGAWLDRRHEGARSRDADTFHKDAAVLEKALAEEPGNTRYAFYLAQSWRDAGELAKSRDAYRRRAAMGGWEEEIWFSLYQIATLSERLGEPPAEIEHAYLAAYQFRPLRAEPLVMLARWHRCRSEWALARLYARAAQAIPRPQDTLFVDAATYRWCADDEAAVAAYWSGDRQECFALCWSLLDGDRAPEEHRARIEGNCDFAVKAVAEVTERYPAEIVGRLAATGRQRSPTPGVTLTVTTCKRLELFERTVNSFLNCCRDIDLISRFICVDDNSSPADRERMQALYPFFEFIFKSGDEKGHAKSMNRLFDTVATPYWLHLEDDWHFVVTTDYVARAISILEAEPELGQVVFNRNYAEVFANRTLVGGMLRRHPKTRLRYVLHEDVPEGPGRTAFFQRFPAGSLSNAWWPHFSLNPSLMRTAAIRGVGRFDEAPDHFEKDFAQRYTAAGLRTAFFDAVVCTHIGRLIADRGSGKPNAYELNEVKQF
jgi:GT2 family glycosyltransferase